MDWVEQVRDAARAALPPVEGEVAVPGLSAPVRVTRDRWGVPHIAAESLGDLFLAQGFVAASERLFQLDFFLRMANGRLATMFADLALPMDRFARTVGWNRAGERVAASWDAESRAMMTAFRAGARAWLEAMPAPPVEYAVLDLAPELPTDEGSWAAAAVWMAWSLNGNWDDELLRVEIAERLGEAAVRDLFPDLPREAAALVAGKRGGGPSVLDLLREAPPRPRGQGSNNWVVAGSRSITGKPLLANDPHLAILMPSIWIEVHLSAPVYEAAGVALPFAPGVVIGRTPRHVWGFTNVGGDTQDLYLERLNEDGTAALYEGAWERVTVHHEKIRVRGRDEPEALEVRETRHGPILDSYVVGIASPQVVEGGVRDTHALRWVGAEHAIEPATLVRIAQAADFAEFRDAVRGWQAPGQNMLYADEDGHIGYQCTGLYPVRQGGNGTMPVPGWTSGFEWDGFIPFEELPWAEDPPEGFLATANNRIHDDAYPHLIGHDFSEPSRIRRIGELLAASATHSPETFAAMQADTVSIPARGLARVFGNLAPADERQRAAVARLREWEGDLAVDSAAACVYEAWCHHLAEALLRPRLGDELFTHYYGRRQGSSPWRSQVLPNLLAHPTAAWFGAGGPDARDAALRRTLDAALDELEERLGPEPSAWRWGTLHRATFAGPLAMIPDLAGLFTGGSVEIGGDDDTVSQGGFEPEGRYEAVIISSWRQIQDLSGPDASLGVHTTGQSGNPASEHWSDLVPLWAEGRHHPLPLSPEAVRTHAQSTTTLVPR